MNVFNYLSDVGIIHLLLCFTDNTYRESAIGVSSSASQNTGAAVLLYLCFQVDTKPQCIAVLY
jgi:hypothetical protein